MRATEVAGRRVSHRAARRRRTPGPDALPCVRRRDAAEHRCRKSGRFSRNSPGAPFTDHRLAHSLLSLVTVKSPRAMFSAIVLLAAVITSAGSAALAAQVHPACAAKQHECGKIATISACCYGDQDAARTDSTPVQSRVEVPTDICATPALPHVVQIAPAPSVLSPVHTSPPYLCLIDLPTLFATFLI
jgi:hypothetical protein